MSGAVAVLPSIAQTLETVTGVARAAEHFGTAPDERMMNIVRAALAAAVREFINDRPARLAVDTGKLDPELFAMLIEEARGMGLSRDEAWRVVSDIELPPTTDQGEPETEPKPKRARKRRA
jgi:hypothetical protein